MIFLFFSIKLLKFTFSHRDAVAVRLSTFTSVSEIVLESNNLFKVLTASGILSKLFVVMLTCCLTLAFFSQFLNRRYRCLQKEHLT